MKVKFQNNEDDAVAEAFRDGKDVWVDTWEHYGHIAVALRDVLGGLTLSELAEKLWVSYPLLDILTMLTGIEELVEWEFLRIVVENDDATVIPTETDGLLKKPAA